MRNDIVSSTDHYETHATSEDIQERYTYEILKTVNSQSTNTTYFNPHETSCYAC